MNVVVIHPYHNSIRTHHYTFRFVRFASGIKYLLEAILKEAVIMMEETHLTQFHCSCETQTPSRPLRSLSLPVLPDFDFSSFNLPKEDEKDVNVEDVISISSDESHFPDMLCLDSPPLVDLTMNSQLVVDLTHDDEATDEEEEEEEEEKQPDKPTFNLDFMSDFSMSDDEGLDMEELMLKYSGSN